jgi:hypothetical protein
MYWVDGKEQIIGTFSTQYMMAVIIPNDVSGKELLKTGKTLIKK